MRRTQVAAGLGVLLAAAGMFLGFRWSGLLPATLPQNDSMARDVPDLAAAREISVVQAYSVPNGTDRVRFTVSLDRAGIITNLSITDMLDPEAKNENLDKFTTGLRTVIKGKKLSELGPVDKIGTSSLTTAAFNKALPELQSQL